MPRSEPPTDESPGVARTRYDPRGGDLALQIADPGPAGLARPHRTNCFALYWVRAGGGTLWVDDAHLPFAAPCLLFFSPYRAVRLAPDAELAVTALRCQGIHISFGQHLRQGGDDVVAPRRAQLTLP